MASRSHTSLLLLRLAAVGPVAAAALAAILTSGIARPREAFA